MSQRITMKRSDQGIVPKYCQRIGEKDTSSWRPMRKIDKKRRVFPSREVEVHIPPNRKFGKSSSANVPAIGKGIYWQFPGGYMHHKISNKLNWENTTRGCALLGRCESNLPNKNSWWPYVPGSKLLMWEMVIQPLKQGILLYKYICIYWVYKTLRNCLWWVPFIPLYT